MKIATRPKRKELSSFAARYASLLSEYTETKSEAALGQVYELGRRALAEGKSLLEVAFTHHQALQGLLGEEVDEKHKVSVLRASFDFLAECLSPYEMAHRGFQDAVTALRQLNETLEAEIKRIAYAVHDEAGQILVAVNLALAELSRELPDLQQQQVGQIQQLLNEVENHLRRYSHELRPTILDDLGWIPAIRFLAEGISKRANLAIHVRSAFSSRLTAPMETALYRIVQEALTNVVKHANARNVWIHAYRENLTMCCSILDDGSGFDPRHVQAVPGRKGLGLIAMQERVSAVGGTLRIKSRPGHGTELLIQLTLEAGCADSRRTGR
jgi:signal transduction histidine kinase